MNLLLDRPVKGARAHRGIRRLMVALSRSERRHTRLLARALISRFNALGRRAGSAYRELKGGDDAMVSHVLATIKAEAWKDTVLRGEFERHYLRVLTDTDATVERMLQLGVMLPDTVGREVVATGGRRVGLIDLTGQTRSALFRALADGRAAGDGPAALARRVEGYVAGGPFRAVRTRALLIARTETKYAQNVSTLSVYREAEAVTGVIAYDNRVGYDDPDCVARDGQFFTFDEAEAETDDEHPNGTLSWGPATGGS